MATVEPAQDAAVADAPEGGENVPGESGGGAGAGAGAGEAGDGGGGGKGAKNGGSDGVDLLPASVVARIVKAALPPGSNVSKDAKNAFAKAASIFVLYLGSAANDACRAGRRSTIAAKDVLAALDELEFDELVEPLKDFLIAYRSADEAKKAAKKRSREETGAADEPGPAAGGGAGGDGGEGEGAGAGAGARDGGDEGDEAEDASAKPSPAKRAAVDAEA